KHVTPHLRGCFAVMGAPTELKTDNGPGDTSKTFSAFCSTWGIKHTTGIPHYPTGQAIIERGHQE
ncbi:POK18 protein, partial [Sapayoa aenigma]|nr:POK18 protein [Sapayoa aenigma]